jgi:DUF4097 and DUF4098 domain-containing protein YvlB
VSGFHDRFPVEGLRRIELRISRGDIRLERISGDMIEVESNDPVQVDVHESTLSIRPGNRVFPERSRGKTQPFFGPELGDIGASIGEMVSNAVDSIMKAEIRFGSFGAADVRIGIPAVLERPEIVAYTGMGEIEMEGLAGDCALQSSSGDITIRRGSGALQATTGRGELSIDEFEGRITARTGSGDATLSDCRAEGAVHTGSGTIECTKISGTWSLQSGAGDVEVRVKDEGALKIATGAGDITVHDGSLSSLSVQSGSGDVECTSILTGHRHQLVTGHGDITIAIADQPGARFQVLTRNGDVRSEYPLVAVGKQGRYSYGGGRFVGNIGDSTIDVELRTSSGDISIKRRGPSNANEQYSTSESSASRAAESGSRRADSNSFGFPPSAVVSPDVPIPPLAPLAPPSYMNTAESSSESSSQPEDHSAEDTTQPFRETGGNPRLAVLENLQYGKISVAEAAKLLEAIDRH